MEYGINIDWVGRLVEAVSGQTLDVYFRDKIFAPLGMKDSGYVTSTSSAPARPACTNARLTAPSCHNRWRRRPPPNSGRVAARSILRVWTTSRSADAAAWGQL